MTDNRQLSYRLRPTAQFHRLENGEAAILLHFPMRAVFLHSYWHPVAAFLSGGEWVPLERIAESARHIPPERIELFLNSLIRKGFVAQDGFPVLNEAEYPSVSVIVPVRNRPEEIVDCLKSLNRLDYPAEKLEVIVVDDASDDETPELAARFSGVRLIRMQKHRQASFCRNRGAEAATGEILAFIDSDCLADTTWLKELTPAFRDPSLGALGGWVDSAFEEKGLDRYEKVKSSLKIGDRFIRSEKIDSFFYVPTCNFLVKRDVYLKFGGLRENLHVGEDVDFCWRMQDGGHNLEYRPMGRVFHKHRNRLAAFCSRRFDYGTSEVILQQLHTDRVKCLYLPPAESFFWLIVLFSIILKSALPLLLCAGLFLADGLKKHGKMKNRRVPVALRQVFGAIGRGYLSFVYHCCSFVSRYYLGFVPLVAVLSLPVAAVVAGMHLVAGSVEYAVRKPRLNLLAFLFFFTMEQASYQAGVWAECFRRFNFHPVLPRIVHRRT